jgi:hypothetical protein
MSNPQEEPAGEIRYPPPGLDVYEFLLSTEEYRKEQDALGALRKISPALEALVKRTEEALTGCTFLIKCFSSSHETKMERLEKKVKRGLARVESRIINLESCIEDLDFSNLGQPHSPIRERSAFSVSTTPSESSDDLYPPEP